VDDAEDINRLIRQLNSPGEAGAAEEEAETRETLVEAAGDGRLDRWIARALERNGSDLLLVADAAPSLRVDGEIEFLDEEPLEGPDIERAVLPFLPRAARETYRRVWAADSAFRRLGRRFRVNLHRERGRAAAAIRPLPSEAPRLSTLGLPDGAMSLAQLPRGLVIVAGPTGSGKSTTLAALVDEINRTAARHVITIEDPIEYEHRHRKSVVEQVEVGIDTPDFASALRSAMRQAPDVLVVGEMRDPETMSIALSAAETGHLVFSTLHTSDAAGAIARMADSFPPERQNTVRQEIAMALAAVLSQHLLPRLDGPGRVVAAELFLASTGARQHIRKNALQHLHQEITMSRKQGAVSLEQSLAELVRGGAIAAEEARIRAFHVDELESLMRG